MYTEADWRNRSRRGLDIASFCRFGRAKGGIIDSVTTPPFLESLAIDWDEIEDDRRYPYNIASIAGLTEEVTFTAPVTFLVGANGSGKSTLLEALAVHQGLNPEGGSQNMMFETRPDTVSELHKHLTVGHMSKPRTKFFLRAESYFNVATKLEDYFEDEPKDFKKVYGGSPHGWSHGESFIKLVKNRFFPGGLFFLDEPEAALSVPGEIELMKMLTEHWAAGSQMIIATHSPILTALPDAQILEFTSSGIAPITWDQVESVRMTRAFMADPTAELSRLGVV